MNELTTVDQSTGEVIVADVVDMQQRLDHYRAIQAQLDQALPDCVMKIQGKTFRKKSYWRAIATAFNLSVEVQEERREQLGDDVVWFISATATAPGGRTMTGDGACAFSEKKGAMATDHNVRSHAITRAKNRAISDLVGFGEVSAEEINHEERAPGRGPYKYESITDPYVPPKAVLGKPEAPTMDRTLTEEEVQGLQTALARSGKKEDELLGYLGQPSIWAVMESEKRAAWEWIKS